MITEDHFFEEFKSSYLRHEKRKDGDIGTTHNGYIFNRKFLKQHKAK